MGLRREVLEEMEEQEFRTAGKNTVRKICSDTDEDIHGIGWVILHNKFIGDDEPNASERKSMKVQQRINKVKKGC